MSNLQRLLPLVALATLALLSLPALRATPQDSEVDDHARPRSYTLNSGRSVRGIILEADGDRVRLRLSISGGTSTQWFDVDDFDPKSRVRLKHEQVAEGDVVAQLAVAEFAANLELYDQSRTELKRCAYMVDHTDEPRPASFKERALALTVRLLEAFCARGDVSEARNAVSRLLTTRGDRLTEDEQALLIRTVEEAAERDRAAKAAERRAKEDAAAAAKREKKLEPIHKHLSKGQEKRMKGLKGSRKYSAAGRDLSSAIKHFEAALKEIAKLRKTYADDGVMLAELYASEEEAIALWQDTLLSRASLDLANGKFNHAMEGVNTILADHPGHREALAMRGRIEVAQNDWGW